MQTSGLARRRRRHRAGTVPSRTLVPGGPMATMLVLDDEQGVRDRLDTLRRRKGTAP